MVGQQISHYTILELLGGGGMGVVYKARDLRLNRIVALKFLPPDLTRDAEAKQRFIHEARAASALDHANICTIYDIDEAEEGRLFIAMAFYDGESVKRKIERGPLKLDDAVDIALQVAQGLAKAHAEGMVHRDVKPANVMVTADGVAKIVDFGLAKLTGMTVITREGTTLGTLGYMSPEQARGEQADRRSDIWSLGVMIYEMVTGRRPFVAEYDNAVIYAILNAEPEPITALRTGIPVDLDRIVSKAMAKDPAERYQHVDEMVVDLKRLRKEGGTAPHLVRSAPPPSRSREQEVAPRRKSRWRKVIAGLAAAAALVVAFIILKPLVMDDFVVSEPKPIAVISFANQTGDRSYDYLSEAIPNLLITSLEQSPYLRVMTWERMHDLLRQMGKGDVEAIDKDLGFDLCRREGVLAIVIGSYTRAGEAFATDVKVLDVNSKELLKSASARGEGVQSILTAQIDELSREIARGVGLSQRNVETVTPQITDVTTTSLDAYHYFLRGRLDVERMYYRDAQNFLKKAVSLDSTFAMAYLYLAEAHGSLLEIAEQDSALRRAKAFSARVPEKERLLIEAQYARTIERKPEKRRALIQELVRKYPHEKRARVWLSLIRKGQGRLDEAEREVEAALALDPDFADAVNWRAYLYMERGQYDQAIQAFQRYASLSPGDANPFDSMAELYLRLGRLDESRAKYREAIRVKPSFHQAYYSLAYVSALQEDYPEAFRWIDSLIDVAPAPGVAVQAHAWKGMYASLTGRYNHWAEETNIGEETAIRSQYESFMSVVHWAKGWLHFERGALNQCRRNWEAFLAQYRQNHQSTPVTNALLRDIHLGLVHLKAGQLDSARTRLLHARARMDSAETHREILLMHAGILEGELLLAEGFPDSAIGTYRAIPIVGPFMNSGWRMPLYNFPGPADVVPRAFQKMGKPDSAIAAYERLLRTDPATDDRRLINPKYHYRLAKVCEEVGKRRDAIEEYARFLELWRDADRDLPEYLDAQKRLALLRKQ